MVKGVFSVGRLKGRIPLVPSFSPADISDGEVWFDAQDGASITESGGAVSQWNDKFNSNNATQSTGDKLTLSTLNGKTALAGDGTEYMVYPNLGLNGLTDVTVFLVLQVDPTTSGFDSPLGFGTSGEGRFETRGSGNPSSGMILAQSLGFDSGTIMASGYNTAQLFTLRTNATDWDTWSNTTTEQVDNSSAGAWTTGAGDYSIMGGNNDSRTLKGLIGEIIIYSKELDDTEITTMQTYLISKWAL